MLLWINALVGSIPRGINVSMIITLRINAPRMKLPGMKAPGMNPPNLLNRF